MTEDNNWLSNNMEQIEYYLASQNEILIERKRCIDILLRLFSYNFTDKKDVSILDLGCGDGILSQILNDRFSGNRFTLIDGSQVMLSKAKDRMKNCDVTCKQMTFEEFYSEPINDNRFDFVFSSMAIHHLQFAHKEMLFSKIYHELSFDGLFLNIDVVLPESAKSEEWQFNLWRDWIFEKPHEDLDTKTKEKHFNIPQIYRNNSENKPSGLIDQLFSLKKIGFRDVDCFYKYGIFRFLAALNKIWKQGNYMQNIVEAIHKQMIQIPGGEIALRDDRINRQWKVDIHPFLLAKYPVTQEQYFAVTGKSPSTFTGEQNPVDTVSWLDAVRFCNELSQQSGFTEYYSVNGEEVTSNAGASGYHLPTEAEWQYACRAGTTKVRYADIEEIAWYKENSNGKTHHVGQKNPNAWGLYDMLGNVWEWCEDLYDVKVYGAYRVFRGGGWCDPPRGVLVTNRRRAHPTFTIDDLGFRLARNV